MQEGDAYPEFHEVDGFMQRRELASLESMGLEEKMIATVDPMIY